MKRKPKKKLTPLQQNRLLKVVLVLVIASILWLLFAPGTGMYSLLKLRSKASRLEVETQELSRTNDELRQEIERLKNDPEYLEQIAREKYGLVKKNEQVFDFSKSPKKQAGD